MATQEPATTTPEPETTDSAEFDPVGTLALILLYFGILVAMWFFIYFVEFLGNDLTVIG